MDSFRENIDKQLAFNRDKNILLDHLEIFQFAQETVNAISKTDQLEANAIPFLFDYATDKAIEEFCRVNQYYSFNAKAKRDLRQIYADLFASFQAKTASVDNISENHYKKLKQWIQETNPFAERIYKNFDEKLTPVACSEYSPDLQIDVLQIDLAHLMQPVLDIGCGSQGKLVHYLKDQGIEVVGIDRFKFSTPDLITVDWLEYDYGKEKWGTIVSNLGFSNHFNHHHLREDGNYIAYGKTFMHILHGLKVGGCFHYAPDLPFIEKYVDLNQFAIKKYEMNEYDFNTTRIQKLS